MSKVLIIVFVFFSVTGFCQNQTDSLLKKKFLEFIKQNNIERDSVLEREFLEFAKEKLKYRHNGERKKLTNSSQICKKPSYSGYLHLPYGLKGYFDFEEGLECSRESYKPNLICFVGHGSIKSREMEANVWTDPEILNLLKEKFVITALYVDDRKQLSKEKQIKSMNNGKLIKTIGEKCLNFQKQKFNGDTQPAYYIVNCNGDLLAGPYYFDLSINFYRKFLQKGLEQFKMTPQQK
ncbi:hypothetical protein [Marinifilum sp. D714]|uniref:hypothetical protein n=1 Tax=Marinifilum sp. D714 TaxID=2937523 RepID=UPI0027BC4047|nr:hypothetical protein [Marinifilum sp. D714]MDQ2178300.1 hypothetical protein [Marinifilum sp. D714]